MTRLSPAKVRALLLAYAGGYVLNDYVDPESGYSRATLRALLASGWIERAPADENGLKFRATAAGREALGICLAPRPRGLRAALERAIRTFFPEVVAEEIEFQGNPRIRKGSTFYVHVPLRGQFNDVDENLLWDAVKTMIREMGWPIGIETWSLDSTVHITWLAEEDE